MPGVQGVSGSAGFLSRKIETAANIATIVVAALLSLVLVKTYLFPRHRRAARRQHAMQFATVGTNLKNRLAGIDLNKNGRTLVLVLSTHCHFCAESARFFRQIRDKVGSDVKLVGIFPEPAAEAESYLNSEGLRFDQVKQSSLDQIGVSGTPTMLLLSRDGIVTETWLGKLAPDKQEEALKEILGVRSASLRAKTTVVSDARP